MFKTARKSKLHKKKTNFFLTLVCQVLLFQIDMRAPRARTRARTHARTHARTRARARARIRARALSSHARSLSAVALPLRFRFHVWLGVALARVSRLAFGLLLLLTLGVESWPDARLALDFALARDSWLGILA